MPCFKNKFCNIDNLRNESDVEQNFVKPLLSDLGFSEDYIETKPQIKEETIGKGLKAKTYRPDYIAYLDKTHKQPIMIIDAKHPQEPPEDGVNDSQLYASVLRRQLAEPKPEQFCIGTNGKKTIVKHYDSNQELCNLDFCDFQEDNEGYVKFKALLSRATRLKDFRDKLVLKPELPFKFRKPPVAELNGIFTSCHRKIWKKEKIGPTDAFYEFAKIMFIKLDEDRRINNLMLSGEPVKASDFVFSVNWLTQMEKTTDNPFDTILFSKVREALENLIVERKKKRIFDKNEKLNLKPSTIREIVSLLEHLNLHGVDEDLNGRMFETFLNATVRGKQLGQFFTPRTVVKFITELADIKVSAKKEEIEKLSDLCCGSAGFLIEAMAVMQDKVDSLPISDLQKKELKDYIKAECLFGADANEIVTRIARMNMYLHSDGGSRIYRLPDSLDKSISLEKGIDKELERDIKELKELLESGLTFEASLTNPPFSMDYSSTEEDDWKILKEYDLAFTNKDRKKPFKSVRSNVLFIERYYDLLKPKGRLITILDDGALCTKAGKRFREFVREKFLIEALISLPKNAFVKAEVQPNTSIAFLRKKTVTSETESAIFIAKCENIGHNDAGKPCLEKDELPKILKAFVEYKKSSIKIPPEKFLILRENPLCFAINPSLLDDEKRFDVYYYPEYYKTMQELGNSKNQPLKLSQLIEPIKQGFAFASKDFLQEGSINLVRIRNIGKDGNIQDAKMVFGSQDLYDQHRDVALKEKDLVMGMDGDDFRAAIIPSDFKGLANQRVAIIRTKPNIESVIIREYINSRFGRIQLERKKTKTTAGHITANDIKNIIMPDFRKSQTEIIKIFSVEIINAEKMNEKADSLLNEAKHKIQKMIMGETS